MNENDRKKVLNWVEENPEDMCKYCIYDENCPHAITCYGGPPIEPPCCSGNIEKILDMEEILIKLKTSQ